jgi:hypothetical protein
VVWSTRAISTSVRIVKDIEVGPTCLPEANRPTDILQTIGVVCIAMKRSNMSSPVLFWTEEWLSLGERKYDVVNCGHGSVRPANSVLDIGVELRPTPRPMPGFASRARNLATEELRTMECFAACDRFPIMEVLPRAVFSIGPTQPHDVLRAIYR